ncbi:MAG TPA: hypothetical protein VN578_20630 [Candidatus Binatia bacterium]|jgi:hypothetical protein|nr:hypothetical protein [Candidatus Binatia bacterium]
MGANIGIRRAEFKTIVRKDEDAITDYQTRGFTDDQEEVRAVGSELASLLQSFKAWRATKSPGCGPQVGRQRERPS